MEYFQCVESRRSCRAYGQAPVEEEKLAKLLEAARLAPTACNYQPFRVVVFSTKGCEAELKSVYNKDWFVSAPLGILVCSVPGEAWVKGDGKNFADVDATIVMDHIILAASAIGLGSCWVANFNTRVAREVLNLEPGWEPLILTPIGYPAEAPEARPRKGLDALVIRR